MARFFGAVGFAVRDENAAPGVWIEKMIEKPYYGDVIRISRRLQNGADKVNKDLTVNNSISILADAFANENFSMMRYVEWMGVFWEVVEVSVERPRLVLTLGGKWDGELAVRTPESP